MKNDASGPAGMAGASLVPPNETVASSLPALGSGAMFDKIASRYDLVNRVLSLGLDVRWRKRVVRELGLDPRADRSQRTWFGERPRLLDVATGTGDLAIALARACSGAAITGLDPSPNMLAIARRKIDRSGLEDRIALIEGDAQALPCRNCEMDAATIAFGIRNVPDRGQALRELARVVRPGGRIAVLELGEPRRSILGSLARIHSHFLVPRIGGWLSGSREYSYLQRSVAAFPSPHAFAATMKGAGLDVLAVIPLTFGVCNLFIATPAEAPPNGTSGAAPPKGTSGAAPPNGTSFGAP
jgi:demethylmenaquinone methyltransferase/2-methoxy-6-polyprenyl-1,4-benzoquinol methylase